MTPIGKVVTVLEYRYVFEHGPIPWRWIMRTGEGVYVRAVWATTRANRARRRLVMVPVPAALGRACEALERARRRFRLDSLYWWGRGVREAVWLHSCPGGACCAVRRLTKPRTGRGSGTWLGFWFSLEGPQEPFNGWPQSDVRPWRACPWRKGRRRGKGKVQR